MKIIFLDFDGVLNHEAFYVARYNAGMKDLVYPQCEFDFKSLSVLNYIIEETGAKVVISSSWRAGRSIEELQELLNSVGFKGEVIDKTPNFFNVEGSLRGNEILHWIKSNKEVIKEEYHEYENYVILDDDSDMLYWQKDNFLHVDRWVGITMLIAHKAIRILNRGRGLNILT